MKTAKNRHNFLVYICPLFLILILNSCGISGTNPESMLREAGLKVNDYEIVSQSDNLERDASAWDYYDYYIKIKDDPQTLKRQLDELVAKNQNWTFHDGKYVYNKEKEDSWDLSIYVNLQNSEIHIEYMEYNIFS